MKPLICPQCGGKITDYSPEENFAVCGYCTTRFHIPEERSATPEFVPAAFNSPKETRANPNLFVIVGLVVTVFVGFIILVGIGTSRTGKQTENPPYKPNYQAPTAAPRVSPIPTPDPNLLVFGREGTGNGMFQDAGAITVDSKGRIYVGDETLRVQQFDERGAYLKTWQIPAETKLYKRARSIEKILVDDNDRLYVQVGGVVLVYENNSSEPFKAINFAPDYIQDFAFRSDGGKLFVVNNGEIETLFHISPAGKTLRKIPGFHTETADAAISPRETAIAAIRLAIDGAGNIFSVYAFGDLGSYQLSYDPDELLIFRFSPEGKYVNKFVKSHTSCGIEVDNQSRIYISDSDSVKVFTNTGDAVGEIFDLGYFDAFALDKQNNVYILKKDKVYKRPAV